MKCLIFLLISWILPPVLAAEKIAMDSESVLPIGALPKNSHITLEPVDPSKNYFVPGKEGYDTTPARNLYNVKTLEHAEPETSDAADLQALTSRKSLIVQRTDLQNFSANCLNSNSCILQNEVPVYKSGFFDFMSSLFGGPAHWFQPENAEERTPEGANLEATDRLGQLINKGNAKASANGKSISKDCDTDKMKARTAKLGTDKTSQCGIEQALQAYKKNKSRIKKEIFIFNDFAHGGTMGKMWLLNSDGTPAKLLDQNPIRVSRGPGGFGSGKGSLKTPNGAVLTKAYKPPRGGNIKDGIELVGLEPENQDIFERGVLIHGWDPYVTTQGCLGVAGTLDSRRRGRSTLGPPPPYLDQLKKNLLKDGGVLVYNFTPDKKAQCKN